MKNLFCERLRELRQEERIGQIKLSQKLGVSKGMISRWEKGICEPALSNLLAIAVYFDVTLDYLAGLSDY